MTDMADTITPEQEQPVPNTEESFEEEFQNTIH